MSGGHAVLFPSRLVPGLTVVQLIGSPTPCTRSPAPPRCALPVCVTPWGAHHLLPGAGRFSTTWPPVRTWSECLVSGSWQWPAARAWWWCSECRLSDGALPSQVQCRGHPSASPGTGPYRPPRVVGRIGAAGAATVLARHQPNARATVPRSAQLAPDPGACAWWLTAKASGVAGCAAGAGGHGPGGRRRHGARRPGSRPPAGLLSSSPLPLAPALGSCLPGPGLGSWSSGDALQPPPTHSYEYVSDKTKVRS